MELAFTLICVAVLIIEVLINILRAMYSRSETYNPILLHQLSMLETALAILVFASAGVFTVLSILSVYFPR